MDVLTREEFVEREFHYLREIDLGKLFIYPTDTIYGLGCDATNARAVAQLQATKKRTQKPFSVIAPNKQWIHENCVVPPHAVEWLEKLPGPYTFVFKLKSTDCVVPSVLCGGDTLGVRLPSHWFSERLKHFEKPIVTTSVNPSGEMFMTSLEHLHDSIKNRVSFIVYEGERIGKPSTIVRLDLKDAEVIER